MKGCKIFALTPSGKSLKKTLERVSTAWYAVSLGASVRTHINTPNQSACEPTTTAVRHQCQGHEIAPDTA